MDEIIIRSLQGRTNEIEEVKLQRWRRALEANEERYREVARLWALTGTTEPARITAAPTAEQLIAGSLRVGGYPERNKALRLRYIMLGGVAAACLLIGLAITRFLPVQPQNTSFAAMEFVTGAAEMVTARLDDGSIVRLAPQSRLRVTPTAGGREVWLDGRAFFAVAKDERRPFTVRTRAGDALVIGTRFEVVVGNEDLRVAVVEGKVSLTSGGETARVTAGEVSEVIQGRAPSVEKVDNVHELLDWVGDFMVFESTPLSEVAREIERRYEMRVIIPDSALARRTVTAWFTDQSVESILTVICRIVDAHCSVQDSVVSIEP